MSLRAFHLLPLTVLVLLSGCFRWGWDGLSPADPDAQVRDASSAEGGLLDGGPFDGGPLDGGLLDAASADAAPDGAAPDGGHEVDAGEELPIVRAFDATLGRLVPADYGCRGSDELGSSAARAFDLDLVPFWRELPPTSFVDVRTRGVPAGSCASPRCAVIEFVGAAATAMLIPDAPFTYRAPGTSTGMEVTSTVTVGYVEVRGTTPIPIALVNTVDRRDLLAMAGASDPSAGGALVGVATDCRGRPVWGASLRIVDPEGVEIRPDSRGMQPFYFDALGTVPEAGRQMTSESGRFGAHTVPVDRAERELCVEIWGLLAPEGRAELLGAAPALMVEGGLTLRDVPPLPAVSCTRS